MIGYSHKHQGMAHFRVDRLSGVEILDSTFISQADFDVADYTNKMIDMFAVGHTAIVKLLCENRLMKTIIDHYGDVSTNTSIRCGPFCCPEIEVNPSGTFYGWIFKFMGGIKILAPKECVEEMKRISRLFL